MKNNLRAFFCLFMCCVLVLLFGCETPQKQGKVYVFDDGIKDDQGQSQGEVKEPEQHSYSLDFDKEPDQNDDDWTINAEGTFKNGVFKSTQNHTYLALKHKVRADALKIEADICVNRPGTVGNVSGYIGLRLPAHNDQFAAVGANGIWLAFHNKQAGIIDTWPNVKLFNAGVDFSKARRVIVEDDVENNVITVSVIENDEKITVMTVLIEEGHNVFVKDANGKQKIKTKFGHDIDSAGFVAFWASGGNAGECVMDNIRIDWKDAAAEEYVPADIAGIRDLYSDTWIASDDLGRSITDGVAAPRDKLVGMFYQIWFTPTNVTYSDQKIYDHYRTYLEGGFEAVKKVYTKGPEGWGHYWGEPYFGYYLTNDRWIIRKHASMLSDIGVDFIFLDVTNGNPLTTSYKAIFKEYEQMRREGLDTPDICFFLPENDNVEHVFLDIWDNIYSNGMYRDLYVIYEGKPLILGNFNALSPESKALLNGFSARRCWALHQNVGDGKDFWNWMCESPQIASYNSVTGAVEEISVSAGILANTSTGRSFSNGLQPRLGILPDGSKDYFQFNLETTGQGLLFAEQMARASAVDPYVVLITEWNEWIAGRWEGNGNPTIANTYVSWSNSFYVDCFNPEFSRDIEPMKGGFGDNYYYQLAEFLRQFKGSRSAPAASGQHEISLDGGLSQWADVWPEYCDLEGDTLHRDSLGYGGLVSYKNESGRNDIVSAKVSRSNDSTYFLAVCADVLSAREGTNWMNLFVNTDRDGSTGWYGYDIVVNRTEGSVERFVDNSWETETVGRCETFVGENYIVIRLDDNTCGIGADFDFKWADNSTSTGEIMQFLDLGDAAPNARFSYAYRNAAKKISLTDNIKAVVGNGASFTAGRPYALSDGEIVAVYSQNTAVLPEMYKNRLFVPAASLGVIKDMSVTASAGSAEVKYKGKTFVFENEKTEVTCGNDTYIIPVEPYVKDGILYVPLNAVAYIAELNYIQNELGTAIITKSKLPGTDKTEQALRELYVSY